MNKHSKTRHEMAGYIDHTLLKPDASKEDIIKLCSEAKKYNFASVCVNPAWVCLASKELKDSGVKTCCVISFPLGSETPEMKAFETSYVIQCGAQEVDMVINIGAVKSGDWELVEKDIRAVTDNKKDALVKVILETCLLTKDEIIKVCEIAKQSEADYVKTSTGFSKSGANVDDVSLMRKTVGDTMGVKASGGIKTYDDAKAMIEAGASRLGASSGIEIVGR